MIYSLNEIFLYFILYSFLGWMIEVVCISFLNKKLIRRGSMIGPFLSIYGFGAIIILILIAPFYQNIISLFIISVITMTLWEGFIHWLLELTFKRKWWDYSLNFLNFKGRVCLFYSLCWGFLSVLLINIIHPFVERTITNLAPFPSNIANIFALFFIIYLFIDIFLSISNAINLKGIDIKQKKSVSNLIKNFFEH